MIAQLQRSMATQLQRASSATGKLVLLAVALLGSQLHASGAPERALAYPGAGLVMGSVMGLAMVAIVIARLLGRNIGLIRSDRAAIFALVFMIAVKVAIARVLAP
jgi:hypothetical protein